MLRPGYDQQSFATAQAHADLASRGWNCDDADDLAGRVRAHDAGRSGRCRLLGRDGELGRVGMVAAILVHGDGDVVAAGWFGHAWDCKSGI